jgi:outer membrane protein insertion porin family
LEEILGAKTNQIATLMQKVYRSFFIGILSCSFLFAAAQTDTVTSIDPTLIDLFTQKVPKKYKINAIKVAGNKYFDQALLLSIANISVGDEIVIPGGDQFAKAIQNLWKQNYFSNVEIYITKVIENTIDIEIVVTERPRLSNFYFKGVKKGEQEDLTGKIGLVRGRVITENMKRSALEAIQKYFSDKGYQNVKSTIQTTNDPSIENSQILTIYINKGNKVKIEQISFAGNTVDPVKLKKQMKETKEKSRLTLYPVKDSNAYTFDQYLKDYGYLTFTKTKRFLEPYVKIRPFGSAKFNKSKFEEDLDAIISYYNAQGYRDASILDTTVRSMAASNSNLKINIKVNEGSQYYFGDISWRGNTKYSDSTLASLLGIKKGDIYNLETLNKRLGKQLSPEGGDISGLYMDDGYLFFRAEPIETAVYNDTIDYEIRIIEGPQATLKNINITGNDKTKDYVIRRELRTIPGEKFSRSDIIRSQRELSQLNFFNPEKINPNVVPNPDDGTVDITWQVEEKSSDQLELSAGWGGGIGLTGTLGVSFNNFSLRNIWKKEAWSPLPTGDGQKLSVRVQSNGKAFRSYNISFTEPWLGGKKRNAFTVSWYDTKFANAYDPTLGRYTNDAANNSFIKTSGVSLALGKQLKWPDDFFSVSFGVNYTRYKLKNYAIDPVNLPGFSNGYSNNLSFRIGLARNSSGPSPIYPTNGSNFSLTLQFTPPYSLIDKNRVNSANPYQLVEYHKWKYTGEWFVPLTRATGEERNKQLILKAAVKAGFIGRYNSKLSISPFERFQVGDAGLSNNFALLGFDIIAHRGYPVYESSDVRVNPDQQAAQQYFTIFNKYVLELRYPFSLNPSSTIYGLAFFEAANGWYNVKEYNPFKLRRSVGVGMRFFLPMFGLLGFDYGIGLDRYNNNTTIKDAARFTFMLGFEPE